MLSGRRYSSRRRYSPSSAGISFSASSARQAGWVKSPVPKRWIPFRRAQKSKWAVSQSRLVAREYLEWICRSAINKMSSSPL